MRILLIQHGESEADILNAHEGRADFSLTERGHHQAELMSTWVTKHYQLDKIYCSPLKRAAQTATHIAEKVNLPIHKEDLLMEFQNGLLAGLSHQEADSKYPPVSNLPLHASVYEMESKLEFRYRAEYILSKILSECSMQDTIAIVTHGGMINQLYHSFLKLPLPCSIGFPTGDTGIHEWEIKNENRYILHANMCSHLDGMQ